MLSTILDDAESFIEGGLDRESQECVSEESLMTPSSDHRPKIFSTFPIPKLCLRRVFVHIRV